MDERVYDRSPEDAHHNWVDFERGVVRREAFLSDDVYAREIGHIFNRSWIFLAHGSEIPSAGSYVTRTLGDAPVIVVRSESGHVHAVLNSCRHRGAKLCRADTGQVRRFVCPYHGWCYEHDGKLVTTSFDSYMPSEMDFSEWGLVPVPRVESYKGMIFGCWDARVESISEYLGDFRFYLDAFAARTPGGMEVISPPHRWRVKTNWKIGALNFLGDSQHIQTTHAGPLSLDPVRAANRGLTLRSDASVQVIVDGKHGCNLNYLAAGLSDGLYETHCPELLPLYAKTLTQQQNQLLKNLRVGVGTVFPNLSFIESQVGQGAKALILRLWHPVSGTEMEILSWTLAEREASAKYKAGILAKGIHNFGVAGVFEQDDIELWQSTTKASRTSVSYPYPYSFMSALPFRDKPLDDFFGPGRAYKQTVAEISQFEFMCTWQQLMSAELPY